MKQILQDLSQGATYIAEAPCPRNLPGHLLIDTSSSLISVGTERMLVDFGKASYLQKARQQPEKVKMVLDKVKTDGLMTTVDAVRSKLAQPLPLGYCNVGVVKETDSVSSSFKIGDRVVSNGPHADVVRVPKNLCAAVPDNVPDEHAAFTVIGSIGLQGIRLAQPTLGEAFTVIGVGLIGLLTVQLLRAQGCRVLAVDFDESKLELAKSFGAEICNPSNGQDPVSAGMALSRGLGIDGVIITASTKSNDPVSQAAQMCRKRGRIVLVGVTGLELNRSEFYEKELTFQVSCSYGPGRYDPEYEEKGNDYPIGYVRWTEQRNFEAILDMMSHGVLDIQSLISHRIPFDRATEAYEVLASDGAALGIILDYPEDGQQLSHATTVSLKPEVEIVSKGSKASVGFIGAGNYASRVLIPAFTNSGAHLQTLSTSGGINSVIHGEKSGFAEATTETDDVLASSKINTVVIATRHDTHADFATKALKQGKHVFVEKPLALDLGELSEVQEAYESLSAEQRPQLMVGFNRRFSPHIKKMKELLGQVEGPKTFIMTMNAGDIPADHWTQDISEGGGRIIGEACHFIDLMRFLVGEKVVSVQARKISSSANIAVTEDKASIMLGFADGSHGSIHYFANGAASFPKERVEVFASGGVLQLDNFRKLKGYGWKGFSKLNLWKQDKGQEGCVDAFLQSIEQGGAPAIPYDEVIEVARVSIEAAQQLRAQSN